MDHSTALAGDVGTGTAETGTVKVDQAIFTSIRSPMGEGYRLVAMSPGITAEERAELTRRSPSHNSLCGSEPEAWGLSSYSLTTRRQCVAITRYAGKEHTARGGQRIHTQIVVMDQENFRRFHRNPFSIRSAILAATGAIPRIKSATCLDLLPLTIQRCGSEKSGSYDSDRVRASCFLATCLSQGRPLIITDDSPDYATLALALTIMPVSCRGEIPFSVGLKYSPARQFQICMLDKAGREIYRVIAGQGIEVLALNQCAPQPDHEWREWFDLIQTYSHQGRLPEIERLTAEMDVTVDGRTLGRIAGLCRDIDRVNDAEQSQLDELIGRHGGLVSEHPMEMKLIRRLISATVRRAAELRQQSAPSDGPSSRDHDSRRHHA